MKHFMGIDPSLKGNAIVIIDEEGKIIKEILISTHKECYINDDQRLLDIMDEMYDYLLWMNEKIYVEGLGFTAKSTTLFERQGLLFLITTTLFKLNKRYKIIPPTTLKKRTTTDGHADKKLMMRVAKCRWGIDFKDDNICDAYCLARMALEDYKNEQT